MQTVVTMVTAEKLFECYALRIVGERLARLPSRDRRYRPTPAVSRFVFWGRRNQIPPNVKSNYYVDQPPAEAWKNVFLLLCLSILDAFLSLWLFSYDGIIEGNPFLSQVLHSSPDWFLGTKLILTVLSVFVLLIHWNFVIAKRTIRVVWLIRTFIAAYCTIVVYEILLLVNNL